MRRNSDDYQLRTALRTKNLFAVDKRDFPSAFSVTNLWLKNEIVAWLKEPAAVLLNMAYPLLMMVFLFVIGGASVRNSADISSPAVALLALTGVLMVGINLPANGINHVRGSDYYYYLRTLPTGVGTRLVAWSGAPFLLAILSALIGIGVGAAASAAHFSGSQIGLLLLVFCVFGLCTTAIGVCFGFTLSSRTSLAVSLGVSFIFLLLRNLPIFRKYWTTLRRFFPQLLLLNSVTQFWTVLKPMDGG